MRRLRSPHDRAIALLALPALGALIADPLLSLVDTAFVGRIGSEELAALGVASAVFGVAFFVFNFLEYGTTSEVARAIGRGETAAAGRATVTALSIAAVAGAAVTVVLLLAAGAIMGAFGATPAVAGPGATYVMIRALAAPAVLVVRASHGAFRGFQDTRTPMIVALAANGLNLLLDPLLIFGFGWGIAGAAWATVVAQWSAAAWFLILLNRRVDRFGLRGARPVPGELRRFLAVGRDLAIRTAALMATFTLATAIATRVSSEAVAAHQVLSGLFLFTALALDALAIAAQALVGRAVGAGDGVGASALADRILVLGVGVGLALSALLMGVGGSISSWFTTDEGVRSAIRSSYWILAAMQPLAGIVFVWDGVFIGLGDFRYLAGAMLVAAASAIVFLLVVLPMQWGLPGVWAGITLFLGVRSLTLGWRRWGRRSPLRGASA